MARMSKKDRARREHLRRQVEWCKMIALDFYLNDQPEKERYWENEARKIQHEIMMLYPRFRETKERTDRKVVFVPVAR